MKKYLILLSGLLLFTISCKEDTTGGGGDDPNPPLVQTDPANPYGDKVFYEIFVRSFADSDGDGIGDLNGVTAKLDYLVDMGVQGIWLMPISPSPSYHGYDVTDYKGIEPDYGTMADFDNLIVAANSKGIEIVLDFVINHSSDQHPWFTSAYNNTTASDYFDFYSFEPVDQVQYRCETDQVAMVDDYQYISGVWHGVGDYRYIGAFNYTMPDLNYGRVDRGLNPVYDSIVEAAKFWLEKGASGLRLDAVKHIYQNERGEENLKLLKKFYNDLKVDYPNVYMIGEVLSETVDIAPFFLSIPSLFHFDAWWKLEGALLDWGPKYYAIDMQHAYNKFALYSDEFNAGTKLSNHDEDRTMSKLGGSVPLAKICAMAIMTTPGQPYIYYGEELGMSNFKTGGDEFVREPILWGDDYTTTWRSNTAPTATVAQQLADENSLLNFYRSAVKLRNETPALQHGTFTPIPWDPLPRNLMAWYRELGDKRVYVLMNGGSQSIVHALSYNTEGATELFNYGGALYSPVGDVTTITLPAYSMLVLETTK